MTRMTQAECPVCGDPEARVRHEIDPFGHPRHIWYCPECGQSVMDVLWDCPHCRGLKLCLEALALCTALNQAQFAEEGRRSTNPATYGQSRSDPARIARLTRIWQRAADRWRRRAGYAPIYSPRRRSSCTGPNAPAR